MSVSSVEEKAGSASAKWSDGVELTPAQIHAAHRKAMRQAGRRLRGRAGRVDEPGAMARPGRPCRTGPAGRCGPGGLRGIAGIVQQRVEEGRGIFCATR
jgi:hypothetical protein